MLRFQGHWIYSKKDNCYFTLFEGVIFLQASATANGGLDTTYASVDWESLSKKEGVRLAAIANKLRRDYMKSAKERDNDIH